MEGLAGTYATSDGFVLTWTPAEPGQVHRVDGLTRSAWPSVAGMASATAQPLRQAARLLDDGWCGTVEVRDTRLRGSKDPAPHPTHIAGVGCRYVSGDVTGSLFVWPDRDEVI